MGIFANSTFLNFDTFLSGEIDGLLRTVTFSMRSTSKRHRVEVADLIITADTETSHICTGEVQEYYPPSELEYLKGLHIKVPDEVKKEFTDYAYIKRKAFGNGLYLGKKGHDIEELYAELVRLYGWSRALVERSDELYAIIDFVDQERARKALYAAQEELELGWIYQWAICLYLKRPVFIYGRKPSQMVECFAHISEVLALGEGREASVFFHNFAYDYQYLKRHIRKYIDIDADMESEARMLATAPHKIIQYHTTSGIVFKCSYRLSNASLAFWASKVCFTRHKKLTGAIDYDIIRYQDTPLTRADWKYMIYDVLVCAECIEKELERGGDTLATIPLTSTGYVRRDARHNAKKDKNARKEFIKASLGERAYKVLKSAQQGGYTHTSRFIAARTIDINDAEFKRVNPHIESIKHFDKRSFYPSEQRVERYPIGKFICFSKNPTPEQSAHFLEDPTHHYIFVVYFKNAKLKPALPFPYISASKALKGRVDSLDIIDDNGRVLEAKGGFILSLTELDLKIILDQYTFNALKVLEVWRARSGYLPEWMYQTIDHYYKGKSDLKKKCKEDPEDPDLRAALMKYKNKLNGIYGMTATDICRASFFEDAETGEWKEKPMCLQAELDKYFSNKNNFMWLQWGIYCTAWARYRLFEEASAIGWSNILYADTDSLFFLSNKKIEAAIEKRNKEAEEKALKHGAYITTESGEKITYDAFEDEKETIVKFRALHSKCYAYLTDDGKLHATIAGVNKRGREEELQDIENLKHGFVFKKCGGTTIKYFESDISDTEINGHLIEHEGAAIICKVEKTIKHEPWEFTEDVHYINID